MQSLDPWTETFQRGFDLRKMTQNEGFADLSKAAPGVGRLVAQQKRTSLDGLKVSFLFRTMVEDFSPSLVHPIFCCDIIWIHVRCWSRQ